MTVVAGATLADGVLMCADCRVSSVSEDGRVIAAADDAQKIIKLNDSTILGYSGDVQSVNLLLPHIFAQVEKRRADAVSISRWLPRFLYMSFRSAARMYPVNYVGFMVGGTIARRNVTVPRSRMLELIRQTTLLDTENHLASRCRDQLNKSADPITVPDSSHGVLFTMEAPHFRPVWCGPLRTTAIGSGGPMTRRTLKLFEAPMLCWPVERAIDVLVEAMCLYLADYDEPLVGGPLLIARAVDAMVESRCLTEESAGLAVIPSSRGFTIRNTETGEEFPLRYPSEIIRQPRRQKISDGLRAAYKELRLEEARVLRAEIEARLKNLG